MLLTKLSEEKYQELRWRWLHNPVAME